MAPPVEPLDLAQAAVAALLLAAAVVALPRAYLQALRTWLRPADGATALLVAALVAAALARWAIAPLRVATVFIGYHLTDEAIQLFPISRYGVGASAFYHALFALLPHDHRVLMGANSVIGVLTLPLLAHAAARLLDDRRAGALLAALVAVTPLFVRNDNSDANNVPMLWWLSGALVLWLEYLDAGRATALAGAMALATLAAVARPEAPALVVLWLGLGGAAVRLGAGPAAAGRARPLSDRRLWIAAALGLALALPHLLHVRRHAIGLGASLTWASQGRLGEVPKILWDRNILLARHMFPWTTTLLAAAALALPGPAPRGRRWLLAAAALGSLVVYVVDLDWANMARVQVPGALLVTLLAAAALSSLWTWLAPDGPGDGPGDRAGLAGRLAWPARLGLATAVALVTGPTARLLFAPTNEEAEEQFLRAAMQVLPREPYTLVRLGHEDLDPQSPYATFTHHYFPDYLLAPPMGPARVVSVDAWARQRQDDGHPAFFFAGMRCYALFRPRDQPRPRGDNLQPACARMRRDWVLEPVLERRVPNRGDVWLEYYGDARTLTLGLYRVRGPAALPMPDL